MNKLLLTLLTTIAMTSPALAAVTNAEGGGLHTCMIAGANNSVYCWGDNQFGQLGDGTTTLRTTPVFTGLTGATQLALGEYHTCARVTGGGQVGAVYCWGYNALGQLGDGSFTNRSTPTLIRPSVSVADAATDLDAGNYHTCASVKTQPNTQVLCWGRNDFGEVGDGTNTHRNVPTVTSFNWTLNAPAGSPTIDVEAGDFFTCARAGGATTSRAVLCWGRNHRGQLGVNSTVNKNVPTISQFNYVVGGVDIPTESLACGSSRCAFRWNGTWKWSGAGQAGSSDSILFVSKPTPFPEVGGANITAHMSMSSNDINNAVQSPICGAALPIIVAPQKALCFNTNNYGELGNNTVGCPAGGCKTSTDNSNHFLVSKVAAGYYHVCWLVNGQLYCSGVGTSGQLGNGSLANKQVLTLISGGPY